MIMMNEEKWLMIMVNNNNEMKVLILMWKWYVNMMKW